MEPAPNDQDRLTIGYTDIDVRNVLERGHAAIRKRDQLAEEAKRGLLRAGSSGCVIDGAVYGQCHRISHLRSRGVDKGNTVSRKLMFQAGEANEDIWRDVTVEGWQGQVLRHVGVSKQGSWGVIEGHPDIILADEQGNGRVCLELKLLSAQFTTIQRVAWGKPDFKHLIQSAVYMWMTGLPTVLCYTLRSDVKLDFRDRKALGGIEKIEPCYLMFYLKFENGELFYRNEFESESEATGITLAGIKEYYQLVADMPTSFNLGARPVSEGFDMCAAKYCTFSETCSRWERNYVTWFNEAKAVAAT